MKTFTIDEANAALAIVVPKLEEIRKLYAYLGGMRDDARAAAAVSHLGGGMVGGTPYVNTLYKVGKLTTQIGEMGVELKDYTRGLIDFPYLRNGRTVYLCWQIGDGDEVEWWHETDGGFAGRERL
ncbi:MAG: DUF2203 domain-containing protein [Blastocatellia bacterium]|nr:DUF2203 domain-containing protein [Blastocatellia bacterium]